MIATRPATGWGTIGGIEDYYFCHHCLLEATLIVTALPPLHGVVAPRGWPMPDRDGKSAEVHLGGLGCVVCTASPTFYFIFFHREKKHVLKSIDVRKQLTGKSSSVVEEALLLFFLTNRKKKKS